MAGKNPVSAPDTPLAVLLAVMRRKWDEGDLDAAAALARAAAPYLHPRRAALRADGVVADAHRLSDAELDGLLGNGSDQS